MATKNLADNVTNSMDISVHLIKWRKTLPISLKALRYYVVTNMISHSFAI